MEPLFLLMLITIPEELIRCGNHGSCKMVTVVKLLGSSAELSLGGGQGQHLYGQASPGWLALLVRASS